MKIIGTGSSVPQKNVSNDMLAGFLDTSDEWITSRTGIRTRRIMTDEHLEDLAVTASQQALASAGLTPNDLDFVICSNVANNYVTPSISAMVQAALGSSCPCIDLNGACAGFVYALDYAEAYLQTGRAKNILIICAEEPSRFCDWHQRETCVLFGDGAGAIVVTQGDDLLALRLTASPNKDVIHYRRRLEVTPYENSGLSVDEPLVLRGREVFRMAVESSKADLEEVMQQASVKSDNVDYYLLHQANIRIINAIREQMGQPEEKFPSNIERFGNTSSASIPILLDELVRSGRIKDNDILAFSAFGAGFVTGAAVLRWSASAAQ